MSRAAAFVSSSRSALRNTAANTACAMLNLVLALTALWAAEIALRIAGDKNARLPTHGWRENHKDRMDLAEARVQPFDGKLGLTHPGWKTTLKLSAKISCVVIRT